MSLFGINRFFFPDLFLPHVYMFIPNIARLFYLFSIAIRFLFSNGGICDLFEATVPHVFAELLTQASVLWVYCVSVCSYWKEDRSKSNRRCSFRAYAND